MEANQSVKLTWTVRVC